MFFSIMQKKVQPRSKALHGLGKLWPFRLQNNFHDFEPSLKTCSPKRTWVGSLTHCLTKSLELFNCGTTRVECSTQRARQRNQGPTPHHWLCCPTLTSPLCRTITSVACNSTIARLLLPAPGWVSRPAHTYLASVARCSWHRTPLGSQSYWHFRDSRRS